LRKTVSVSFEFNKEILQMLTVMAKIKAKPGKEEETKAVLEGLLKPTRQEEGCIQYDMHQDHDDPSLFFFYENWESREHLDRHLKTPHLKDFLGQEDALLEEPVAIHCMTKSSL